MQVRLQKFMAEAGVASRRACEDLIREGRVSVNGQVISVLGTKIDAARDQVCLDGERLRSKRKLYLAVHKPRGVVCTRSDPQKRRIISDLLPREWSDLTTIGRLDRESEGLILMTNDGEFHLRVAHPRYGVTKTYRVTVRGRVHPAQIKQLERGIHCGPDLLKIKRGRLLQSSLDHSLIELELTEGKNREIRRLLEALDLEVDRLQRIRIGPVRLGELPTGRWRTLTEPETKSLLAGL
ncbi:MAG TPA: pseudouridine synthase [Candidatus Paceibacterota bacterium]|nr:pseudouridine synthase [Verrucomicrobiota bacterium]HRY49481.1 pseudouridine synthase [Candidatus Paceibacterota bacterium]HRZ99312.1 pseudouridine synthase [Candidatus Paceibacterota bacterium]